MQYPRCFLQNLTRLSTAKMKSLVIVFSIFALCQARPYVLPNSALRPSLMNGGEQYVAGGTDAEPGEFPWQLSLQYMGSHSSGAILLSANYALTSAHVVDGAVPSTITIAAGVHRQSDLTGAQIVGISSYTMHEGYNTGVGTFAHDIAILTLATPVVIGGNVQPATLPADDNNSYAGYTAIITGWGNVGLTESDALQKASIQVLSKAECSSAFASSPPYTVTDDSICVYDPDRIVGVCSGDGGGPMNCMDGVTRVIGVGSGVIADGSDWCQHNLPSVYTRVTSYLEWIAANTP